MTTHVAIAVPVRNEAERLPRLLLALARQRAAPKFTLCLFLDACDDGSAELIDTIAPCLPYPVLVRSSTENRAANAGAARYDAVALALGVAPDGVILTTDADSQPSDDWLAANLSSLQFADLIAGKIVRSPGREPDQQDRLGIYYDRLHGLRRAIDPVPWECASSHHWTSAASFALHARDYVALGGFQALTVGEDAALADRAARAGLRLRRDDAVVVMTSSRRDGRAVGGFASALLALDAGLDEAKVAHPDDELWRFRLQAMARHVHGSGDLAALATALSLDRDEVAQVSGLSANGEAFAARVVGAPPQGMRMISLSAAEASLMSLQLDRLEVVA